MRTLRFHQNLYSAVALDRSIEAFAEVANFERHERSPYYEVEITAADDADESEIVSELGNYVLALTIEERRAGE